MSNFIDLTLTGKERTPVTINVEHIVCLYPEKTATVIIMTSKTFSIAESYDRVKKMLQ